MSDISSIHTKDDSAWVKVDSSRKDDQASVFDETQLSLAHQMSEVLKEYLELCGKALIKFDESLNHCVHLNYADFLDGRDIASENDRSDAKGEKNNNVEGDTKPYVRTTQEWLAQQKEASDALERDIGEVEELFKFNQARAGEDIVSSKAELDSLMARERDEAIQAAKNSSIMKALNSAAESGPLTLTPDVATRTQGEGKRISIIPVFKAESTDCDLLRNLGRAFTEPKQSAAFDTWKKSLSNSVKGIGILYVNFSLIPISSELSQLYVQGFHLTKMF